MMAYPSSHQDAHGDSYHDVSSELEIIKNLRYSQRDKVRPEYGRILCAKENHKNAISILKDVTTKLNADWRAVYRSFRLLSRIYKKLDLPDEEIQALCLL
jgi:hypothetical protein